MKTRYLVAAPLLLLTACSNADEAEDAERGQPTTEEAGTPEDSQTGEETTEAENHIGIGTSVIHLGQEIFDEVAYIVITEPLLFRTEEEWTQWYERAILEDLRDLQPPMSEPSFDGNVAVAGNYFKCSEYSYLDAEDGEISFHVDIPQADEETLCYWSPNQFVVYEVSLNDLGVSDPADVTISPEYY